MPLFGDADDQPVVAIDTSTGSSADIVERVKVLLPKRWFAWAAPYRDAIIGGLADVATTLYALIAYARLQVRVATATGIWLDIIAYDFLGRYLYRAGLADDDFQALIQATVLQERVTRPGMVSAITKLVGIPPQLIEPWSPNDCGGYGMQNVGYGRAGAWGSIALPNQVFIKISRNALAPSGVPWVDGYGGWAAGYATPATSPSTLTSTTFGASQYIGSGIAELGITDDVIERIIGATRPTATIAWIKFADGAPSTGAQSTNTPQGGQD